MTDWTALLAAAYEQNADDHAIERRHLERFRLVAVEPDGSVVVEVERHPSLFSLPTRGTESGAFVTWLRRYHISSAAPAFELIDETRLGVTIDIDRLARDELEFLWEVLGDDISNAVAAGGPVRDVCRRFLDDWDLEATYVSDDLPAEELTSLLAKLRARLVELLIEQNA